MFSFLFHYTALWGVYIFFKWWSWASSFAEELLTDLIFSFQNTLLHRCLKQTFMTVQHGVLPLLSVLVITIKSFRTVFPAFIHIWISWAWLLFPSIIIQTAVFMYRIYIYIYVFYTYIYIPCSICTALYLRTFPIWFVYNVKV